MAITSENYKITTRAEAFALGEETYFTGNPCPQGHIARRFVKNYNCVSCWNKILFKRRDDKRRVGNEKAQ